jgi:hypothetical protein
VTGLLLRLYPRAWRVRYGAELEALILETSGRRPSLRDGLDVAAGALRERLRAAGLAGDPPPAELARSGALLVLCAWTVFVVAGGLVQKLSEHWQGATPAGARGLPSAAFDVLLGAAALGTALVLGGVALALPALARFLRAGGWPLVRARILAAAGLSLAAGAGVGGLAVWARGLTGSQRNGSDPAYSALVAVTVVLLIGCLAAWTAAAVACARRVHLAHDTVLLQAGLAIGVTIAMTAMTVATAVWWGALARSAQPGFFGGSPIAPQLLAAALLMLAATVSGAYGAGRALRGVRLG